MNSTTPTSLIDKKFKLHVCKDGTVTIRQEHEPVFNGVALPFYSTDEERLAKRLQILLCRREITTHPLMPDEPWFTAIGFGGELEDIPPLQARFQQMEQQLREKGQYREDS